MRYRMLQLSVCLFVLSCYRIAQPSEAERTNSSLPVVRIVDSLSINKEELRIYIDKSEYLLQVRNGKKILKEYPVVLGGNPIDDKLRQGDSCTPEGVFKVRDYYPHKSWSKFIWIDYPNENSWRKHNKAKEENRIPENCKIGGEIGIHGVPKGKSYIVDNGINWTHGCISLRNEDVNDLYTIVFKGMEIEIVP